MTIAALALSCTAAVCCPAIPTFNIDPPPGDGPAFPATPSLGNLERFLSDTDLFRENEVEGYANRLKEFSDDLDLLDAAARQPGVCLDADYRTFKNAYEVEHRKITGAYREPYRRAINRVNSNVHLYKGTHARCVWNRMNGGDGCE